MLVPDGGAPARARRRRSAHAEGIRALRISLVVLQTTTLVQVVIVAFYGTVALLADTVHNRL